MEEEEEEEDGMEDRLSFTGGGHQAAEGQLK